MFEKIVPEKIIFGYHNDLIEAEHKYLDYLDGDDCTVNPSIGWNPSWWKVGDQTFEHLNLPQKVHTGSEVNGDIRKYQLYCDATNVTFRKLKFDITGDECYFDTSNPFTIPAMLGEATDGYQFSQNEGKTALGDTKFVLDRDFQRPMKLIRSISNDYEYEGLLANPYSMPFQSEYGCSKGIYIYNSIDMTSFLQYPCVITKPQFRGITEHGFLKSNINFSYPLDKEPAPLGIPREDSFYVIEPYTGITLWFSKKQMTK